MREYLLVMAVAAIFTYAATPLARWLAFHLGGVHPVRARDVHSVPIPRLGGLAMFLGFAAAVLVGSRLPYVGQLFANREIFGVLLGAVIITALGALDDIRDLDWLTKLAGQVIAAGVMAYNDVQLLSLPLGGVTVLPKPLLVTLTVLIVVVTINAVNWIDGLDGLAAGVVFIAAGAFFAWSYLVSHDFNPPNVFTTATFITAALMGCCLGFLPHNVHPARLFMGDSGAMLLGLLLAAATISMTGSVDPSSSVATTSAITPFLLPVLLPVAIMALPILDMLLALIRRTRAGQAPWKADRHHLHHQMLQIGHSHRRAVALLWVWAALIAVGAVSFAFFPPLTTAIAMAVVLLFAAALTWRPWDRRRRALRP